MPPKHRTTRSDLFLVRFWLEDTDGASEGQSGWGGKVQRAVTGESQEFSDWGALVMALRAMLAATSPTLAADGLNKTQLDPPASIDRQGEQQ